MTGVPARASPDDDRGRDRVETLVAEVASGNRTRIGELVGLLYPQLRRLARACLRRERPGQTVQATALVHEAYVRLVRERRVTWQNRAHFCAIAANAMRQILVERARARRAAKRGGGAVRVTLADVHDASAAGAPDDLDVLALNAALDRLARLDAARATLVELRYFGGLTIDEAAEALGTSPASVKRSWALARAWLARELGGSPIT